jgi:hypothetical protein
MPHSGNPRPGGNTLETVRAELAKRLNRGHYSTREDARFNRDEVILELAQDGVDPGTIASHLHVREDYVHGLLKR